MSDTITRAVTTSLYTLPGTKARDLWPLIHRSFDLVQVAANEVMRQYFIGDGAVLVEGKGGRKTLPQIDKEVSNIAYHEARRVAPELPSGQVADICQRVRARYMKDRWACRVVGAQSVPTFRSPLPVSVRTQDWALGRVEAGGSVHYTATFGLLGLRGKDRPTFGLACKGDDDKAFLERVIAGEWERRTIEILPPGWIRKGRLIRAKVVYRRPAAAARPGRDEPLVVRTGSPSLLTADTGGRGFAWNARSLRGKIIAYERDLHMRSQDRKMERRVPASRRRAQNDEGGCRAEKHANRVRAELQWIASQVAGYTSRQRFPGVVLDTSDRSWVPCRFPWEKLERYVSQACEGVGLSCKIVRGESDE